MTDTDVGNPDDLDRLLAVDTARHQLADHPIEDLIERLDGGRSVRNETSLGDTEDRSEPVGQRWIADAGGRMVDDPDEERQPAGVEVDQGSVLVEGDPTHGAHQLDRHHGTVPNGMCRSPPVQRVGSQNRGET